MATPVRAPRGKAIGLLALLLVVAPAAALAQGALPPHVAARIDGAAREAQGIVQRDAAFAATLGDQRLAAVVVGRAGQSAARTMSAAVVEAIVRDPGFAPQIVSTAVAAAPQYRDAIVGEASRAFPGFAPAITAAAGGFFRYPRPPARPGEAPPEIEAAAAIEQVDDPLEGLNRAVFFVNDQLDTYLIRPIASTYGLITPDAVKRAVRNFFLNLNSPARFANDLLQGEIGDAGVTGARFLINSSVGLAGFLDVAEGLGHAHQPADFGQTLYVYGAGPGPYLVLPLFGPGTLRSSVGIGVDSLLDPFTYLFDTVVNLGITVGDGVVRREDVLEALDEVRATSIDYYAAVRSLYLQDRAAELRRGQPAGITGVDLLFEEFE
ncbi:MAG: VacJ family lipoprotein [Proteobacteria bacterium]|nr:VacJ family lipoprotein [Pseudomonadota bacterium]